MRVLFYCDFAVSIKRFLLISKQSRLRALERQAARLERRIISLNALSDQYVRVRVGVVAVAAIVVFLAFSMVSSAAGWISLALALAAFNIVAVYHGRVKNSIRQHQALCGIKRTHIARIRLEWERLPFSLNIETGDHPFALDLDLVGERSLHRLIDTAVSREGSLRLGEWLLDTTPDPACIQERQALIRELIPMTAFRDQLTLHAQMVSGSAGQRVDATRLLSWFKFHGDVGPRRSDVLTAAALAFLNLILMILSAQGAISSVWVFSFFAYGIFSYIKLREAGDLFGQAMSLGDAIRSLHGIFSFLETYRYGRNQRLRALCAPFLDTAQRPSMLLRRLSWIVSAASLRANGVLWLLIHFFVPWDLFFAYQLKRRKDEVAAQMPVWLDRWFEIEAHGSLATFAALNPEYSFPNIAPETLFSGRQIGHPLIGFETKICNDFEMNELGSVVIITGSNMSGKSSFLRALGMNLCLAYAGSVVNAQKLNVGLFRLYSCIKVSDSVTDGFSYFYAEVRRLKALLNALRLDHPYPVFYLIDEIFKGTNNRERLIGSRAYIRSLVGLRGMGVISTHDLDLVRLADEMPQIGNVHFREEVVEGRMVFDYHLRPGPCPTTNALKIMQLEGLPVEVDTDHIYQD